MKLLAVRLLPGQDLREEIIRFAKQNTIEAGCIVSCVGSLQKVSLRFAGQITGNAISGKYEIIALSGTLGTDGIHLHMAVADENGQLSGGHVLDGCTIYTTAEIVIAHLHDIRFSRESDAGTGYNELVISPK